MLLDIDAGSMDTLHASLTAHLGLLRVMLCLLVLRLLSSSAVLLTAAASGYFEHSAPGHGHEHGHGHGHSHGQALGHSEAITTVSLQMNGDADYGALLALMGDIYVSHRLSRSLSVCSAFHPIVGLVPSMQIGLSALCGSSDWTKKGP